MAPKQKFVVCPIKPPKIVAAFSGFVVVHVGFIAGPSIPQDEIADPSVDFN